MGAVHGPIVGYMKFANVDEAYAAALGERLLEGYTLYEGAVSQRGPLMYYLYALFDLVDGWDNVLALRLWAFAFCVAHLLLAYWGASKLLSRSAAVVAALATAYALGFGFPPIDAVALHGEALQLPLLIPSVVLGATALRAASGSRRRTEQLLASGVLLGAAICIKQSVLLHVIPLGVWIAWKHAKARDGLSRCVKDLSVYVAGVAALPLAFVAHAALRGTLRRLVYYCVTYNVTIHLQPTRRATAWLGLLFDQLTQHTLFFLALVLLAAAATPFVRRRLRSAYGARRFRPLFRGFGVRGYLALHLAVAIGTASSMYRFFPHYYLQALPFLTWLLGAVCERWMRRRATAQLARVTAGAFAVFLVISGAASTYFGEKIDGRVAHEAIPERIGKYIAATTQPDQRIFVWGFSPWIYEYAHRRPAGRFVFETYVTGFVPWFWDELPREKARVVPGAMAELMGDLDRERPEVVVDAGAVLIGRPIRSYGEPAQWLHEHYCFEVRLGAIDVYRRKTAPCKFPHFPQMAFPVDYYGRPAPYTLMPTTLDRADSRWLPPGIYSRANFFHEQDPPPRLDAIRDRRAEKDEAEGLSKIGVKDAHELLPPPPCE